MSLRISALAVLLSAASLSAASSCPEDLPAPTVGVLLRFDHPPQRGFVNELRHTVEQIFQPAGLSFRWAVTPEKQVCGHRTVIIDLHGSCGSALLRDAGDVEALREFPLGWTLVVGGEVLPTSLVDCDRIMRASLQIGLARSHPEWRNLLYVRLAGRVVAHELMHALLRISDHDGADLTRSPLRLEDFRRPLPRLTPAQITALRQIGSPSPTVSAGGR